MDSSIVLACGFLILAMIGLLAFLLPNRPKYDLSPLAQLRALFQNHPQPDSAYPASEPVSNFKKATEILTGFVGWYLVNGVIKSNLLTTITQL